MATTFYILLILGLWHWVYEGIIAPSLRHTLRYKFFDLRDQLRFMYFKGLNENEERAYHLLDGAVCRSIQAIPFINLGNYFRIKNTVNTEQLREEIRESQAIVSNSDNDLIKDIDRKISRYTGEALVINHGGYLPYLIIPLVLVILYSIFMFNFNLIGKEVMKVSKGLVYTSQEIDDNLNLA